MSNDTERRITAMNEAHLRMLSDAALLADAEKPKEGATTATIQTTTRHENKGKNLNNFSTTMKRALPQSSNTTNGGDDSDDEDYVIGNLEWDSGGSGSDDDDDDEEDEEDDDYSSSGDDEDSSDKEEENRNRNRKRTSKGRSVPGKLSSPPVNKVGGEREELEYSESEEEPADEDSDSDSDIKRAKRYEELEAEKFSRIQKQEKSTRAGVRRVQFENNHASAHDATREEANAKVANGKEVSKDIIRDTTGWIPLIASPMKALPGSLDFYERQIALNDISAPNGIHPVSGTGGLHYFSDSDDDDDGSGGGHGADASNRSASRPSAGPIARRTRARFNMDDVSLDELEQRLNTLPDEEEMMFASEKDIYEDFLSAIRVIDTNEDISLLDNMEASDGIDRKKENNDDDDDDDDDDDEDFEDEDVRAREFQLKLRAERRRMERYSRDSGKENIQEGETGKASGKIIPQHMPLVTRQSQRIVNQNARKLILMKRKSHMTKSQVNQLRNQIAIHSQLLIQTFALHACGESTEYQGLKDLSLNSESGKCNKDMLNALDVAYKARIESSERVVNVFDNDMVRNAAQYVSDVEEYTRSVSPDLLKFTREEGKLWMSPRDRMTTPKSRHKSPNLHFSRIDCMFRVDDRTPCMDYPGAKRSEHVTEIAWKPASKQLIRLTREFALKVRMQRAYFPGENSLLSFLVPKLIGYGAQSEEKEAKLENAAHEYVPSRTKWLYTEDILLAHALLTFGCCSEDTCQDVRTSKQREFMMERFGDVQQRFLPAKTIRAINDRLIQLLFADGEEDNGKKDTLWHANNIIRRIRRRKDVFLTREDVLFISDVLESVKGLDSRFVDRHLLWRDIAAKLETKFRKNSEYDSEDFLMYVPGLLSDQYERMKWSILRRGDEPAKRVSASDVNPSAVVPRPNKKRRKPAALAAEGRSSRHKMQAQNPSLQEHVVVLEELQYSESDESDEDFDEGEAEELEYSDSSELEDEDDFDDDGY